MITKCRHCGEPMRSDEQTGLRRPIVLVTCDNQGCPLEGYTFSLSNYDTVDLDPYYKQANAKRKDS